METGHEDKTTTNTDYIDAYFFRLFNGKAKRTFCDEQKRNLGSDNADAGGAACAAKQRRNLGC